MALDGVVVGGMEWTGDGIGWGSWMVGQVVVALCVVVLGGIGQVVALWWVVVDGIGWGSCRWVTGGGGWVTGGGFWRSNCGWDGLGRWFSGGGWNGVGIWWGEQVVDGVMVMGWMG